MNQTFEYTFENMNFPEQIKQAFSNATVNNLIADKKSKTLITSITCDNLISYDIREMFRSEINRQVPYIKDVILEVKLSANIKEVDDVFNIYWDLIRNTIMKQSKINESIMRDAFWKADSNKVQIFVKNNMAYLMTKRKINSEIQDIIYKETGRNILIQFKDTKANEEEINKTALAKDRKVERILSRNYAEQANKAEQVKAEKIEAETKVASDNATKGILYGKKCKDRPVPIKDSKEQGDFTTILGHIFNVEKREIKGEKYIVSFDIYDKSDSTTVKFFITKEVFDKELNGSFKAGKYMLIQGHSQFDNYAKEMIIMARNINLEDEPPERMDTAEEKRVELHLHTQMSMMDGVTSVKEYIKRAIKWGHKAIAITDHGVAQAFPDAMETAYKSDLKVIYGVEGYFIDDTGAGIVLEKGQTLDTTFVIFDIETTGLSQHADAITEIGAVKVKNGEILDRFSTLINPQRNIPEKIVQLTKITNEMVADAPTIDMELTKFLDFIGDSILVAHNADFDMGFIRSASKKHYNKLVDNTVVDTLELAFTLLPELKNHKLDTICSALEVSLEGYHRAVNDAEATSQVFFKFIEMMKEKGVSDLKGAKKLIQENANYNKYRAKHIIILAKNKVGLKNLYQMISKSHLNYFYRKPRIPKSVLMEHREGLIIGSACEAGELYSSVINDAPDEIIEKIVDFYDYLEIQPTMNNGYMINSPRFPHITKVSDINQINKKIVELGEKYNKPVVATCDVHFIDEEHEVFRRVLMAANGFDDADNQAPLYYRTTNEMIEEFEYLGEEKAYEVVVTNTNLIADMVEKILPIPAETFPPKIEGADDELREICMEKAVSIYGSPLPEIVAERLETELTSIIGNGYAVLYIIAQKLVWKSMEDGYLVGSRGSVGSSFAANMAGITEVNSLPPHYICENCQYSDFDSDEVRSYAMEEACGCDMPDKECPKCGTMLIKEGHDIPFQTFLGFEGDKEPDIDLNFSGEYQQNAHAYTEVLFGEGYVFKAGTIGTLAEKTAYGYVQKYFETTEKTPHKAEVNRLTQGCLGVKRTTGQHPGGLMVVPQECDIHDFCPIQRPANDVKSNITTTHFDYHAISGRLLKLDLLGHDDPTIIRMLHDLTGTNPQDVSLGDKETMSLFHSPKALGVSEEDINCNTGTLGVPEFGTNFVRTMLKNTSPQSFSDLLRISGLSHGTGVWLGNAQKLINDGIIQLKDTISTRDGIMIYLINKGMDKKLSFKIMENVRKGKGVTPDEEEEMKKCDVPDWYIWSCKEIKYMFPKAHAAAYVMMAFRIAYYKINYPREYYATYFTIRASDDFDYTDMCYGMEQAKKSIAEIQEKGNEATTKEKSKATVLELVIEFYARGFRFTPMDLYKSDSSKFIVTDEGLLPPFNSLQGLGTNAAISIVEGRKEGEFCTLEQLRARTSIGKSMVQLLKENGILAGIPESNQLSLFD